MSICPACNQEMTDPKTLSCTSLQYWIRETNSPESLINPYYRIPYKPEGNDPHERCHDCGIATGLLHHPGCDVELCPRCKGQAITCDCEIKGLEPFKYTFLPDGTPVLKVTLQEEPDDSEPGHRPAWEWTGPKNPADLEKELGIFYPQAIDLEKKLNISREKEAHWYADRVRLQRENERLQAQVTELDKWLQERNGLIDGLRQTANNFADKHIELEAKLNEMTTELEEQRRLVNYYASQRNRLSEELEWYNATREDCRAAWDEIEEEVDRLKAKEKEEEENG